MVTRVRISVYTYSWTPKSINRAWGRDLLLMVAVALLSTCPVGWAPRLVQARVHSPVFSLAFSADGTMLAVGSDLLLGVEIRNAHTLKLITQLKSTIGQVSHIAFSPDGKVIAAGGEGGVELWSIPRHERQGFIFGISSAVAFHPSLNFLAIGGDDPSSTSPSGLLETWNTAAGKRLRRLRPSPTAGASDLVSSVSFSGDGKHIVAGIDSGIGIELWDAVTGRRLRTFASPFSHVVSASTLNGGKILVAGGQSTIDSDGGGKGLVAQWDAGTGKLLRTLPVAPGGIVGNVAFAPDGKSVAIGGLYGTGAELWSLSTGKLIRRFGAVIAKGRTAVSFSPDGRQLAVGNESGTLDLWDVSTWRLIAHV